MGELASSPPPPVVLPVVFVDGDQSVDLGTVTVQPSLGFRKLQAMIADRVGVAPSQIAASLARARRARRVPLDESSDLAAAAAREGAGCHVLAVLRRSRRERRGGRSRRDKKAAPPPPTPEKTILKRLPPPDLAPPPAFGPWDYEVQLRELQRQRERYLLRTAAAEPYGTYGSLEPEPPPLWSTRPPRPEAAAVCGECEEAAAAMRAPSFHWCVRDAVTVGFRSPVGPIERPAKKSPSPPPAPPIAGGVPVFLSSY